MNRALRLPDRRILSYTSILVILGLVSIYGATSYELGQVGNPLGYFSSHLQRVLVGVMVCAIAALTPFRHSGALASRLVWVALFFLALTLFDTPLRVSKNGIARWIQLGPFVFQPVEFVKLGLVLALPVWIDENPRRLHTVKGMARLMAPLVLAVVCLILQPNFGSALALSLVGAVYLWIGGARAHHLLVLASAAVAAAFFAFNHHPKLYHRMLAWKDLLLHERYTDDWGYQGYQAVMGLGNGGLRGVAPGEGITRYEFLPEGHTDFIFSILGEEWGFLGAALVVVVFGLLVARALRVAHRSRDGVGYLMACGIGMMIAIYTVVNLAVVTSLFPVTGLPLPFLSFGGTALITNMAAIGVLLNISRHLPAERQTSARLRRALR